ncbi:MAG: PilZ domain-containing protein [Pseudomonadota bacterium]
MPSLVPQPKIDCTMRSVVPNRGAARDLSAKPESKTLSKTTKPLRVRRSPSHDSAHLHSAQQLEAQVSQPERRGAVRKRARTQAYLHHPSLPTHAFQTRDMSAGGVFIESSARLDVQQGDQFPITFAVDVDGVTRLHQFIATVAQREADGLGLRIVPA